MRKIQDPRCFNPEEFTKEDFAENIQTPTWEKTGVVGVGGLGGTFAGGGLVASCGAKTAVIGVGGAAGCLVVGALGWAARALCEIGIFANPCTGRQSEEISALTRGQKAGR